MGTATPQPNILIIHADQHRHDCIGAYGNPDISTPNIDSLAADGVRFTDSYCPYPVCTPSRYSLLTGQYVCQHLGWNNYCTLPSGIATFPRLLRDSGYSTQAVGKMHFTPTYLDVGFDKMVLAEQDGPGRFDDDYHRWLKSEGLIDRLDLMDQRQEYRKNAPKEYWDTSGALRSDLDEAHHSTTWIADQAIAAIQGWTDGGNLLMAGFIKPHHPFDPPAPWDTLYNPDSLSLLSGWLEEPLSRDLERNAGYFPHKDLTEKRLRRAMALYYGSISQIDYHVGRMVDLLKKKGMYDDTLVVYTSDHGDYLGYHHLLLKGNYMYDALIKVPLIIKLPGRKRAGEVSEDLVSNIDLAPTLLGAAATPVSRSMGGIDLDGSSEAREVVFAEGASGGEYMVRTKTHKLLLCAEEEASQFFDLRSDPFEVDNRIGETDYTEEIRRLREALFRWSLFTTRGQAHLDVNAPRISGENIPEDSASTAKEMADYVSKCMTADDITAS